MKNFVKLLLVLFQVIFCLNLSYAQADIKIAVTITGSYFGTHPNDVNSPPPYNSGTLNFLCTYQTIPGIPSLNVIYNWNVTSLNINYSYTTGVATFDLDTLGTSVILLPAFSVFSVKCKINDSTLCEPVQNDSLAIVIPNGTVSGQIFPIDAGTIAYNDSLCNPPPPPPLIQSNETFNFMVRLTNSNPNNIFIPILNQQSQVIGFDFEMFGREISNYSATVSSGTVTGSATSSGADSSAHFFSKIRTLPAGTPLGQSFPQLCTDDAMFYFTFETFGDTLWLETLSGSAVLTSAATDTSSLYFGAIYKVVGGTGIFGQTTGIATANGLLNTTALAGSNEIDFFFRLLNFNPPSVSSVFKQFSELNDTSYDSLSAFPLQFRGVPSSSPVIFNGNVVGFNVEYFGETNTSYQTAFSNGTLTTNNVTSGNPTIHWQGKLLTYPANTVYNPETEAVYSGTSFYAFAPGDTLFFQNFSYPIFGSSLFGVPTYDNPYENAFFIGGSGKIVSGTNYFSGAEGIVTLNTIVNFDSSTVVADYYFRVSTPFTSGIISGSPAKVYVLAQNYPNPFNPTTKIPYQLKEKGFVSLKIYNTLGQEVKTLVSRQLETGNHETLWDGTNNSGNRVSGGVYFYRLKTGNFSQTKKLLLLK